MISGSSVQITQVSVTFEEALSRTREPLKLIHPDWGEGELHQFQQKVRVETRSLIAVNGEPPVMFDIRQIDLTPLEEFMAEMSSPARAISLTSRERLEFSAGIVGVALAYISLNDQLGKMNSILGAGLKAQGRLAGMGLALAGGAAELVGKTLEHGRGVFLAEARFVGTQRALMAAGRFLGLAGGVILGLMDIWEGGEKLADGEWTLGGLYIFSGSSTIGASIAIFSISAGLTGVFSTITLWWIAGILGIFAIAAAIAILWFTENDLQEWLAECAFGERGAPSPSNAALENEMQRLKAITHEEN